MIKALKALVITTGLVLTITASIADRNNQSQEQLLLDDLYACHWWPMCRDPDQQNPAPRDSLLPQPSGDKDTTKDKKDEAQLA